MDYKWYYDNDWWVVPVVVISFFVVLVLSILFLVNHVTYDNTRTNCPKYATARNITTKFVKYNYWQFDCLQKTPNNTWIPVENNVETNR